MTQDMNHTFVKALRAVFVAAMMLTSGNAMADGVVVKGNVYGGGNAADVGANATVNISGGQIGDNQIDGDHGNVFGGGKGPTTTVVGKVEVNIGKKVTIVNEQTTVTYSDNGTVKGSVYGGSAFGAVNGTKGTDWDEDNLDKISLTSDDMTTAVNIYAGTVNGNVYGGGRGEKTSSSDIAAKSFGAVTVIIGDANVDKNITVDGSVYGGSDVNGVLKSNVRVDVVRGTIGKSTTENEITTITGGNVYGGGLGQPTLVYGNVAVNIHGGTIMKDVYGGGALGNTNIGNVTNYGESNESITTTSINTTIVSLIGGTVDGDVYGGGLGKYTSASDNVPAKVYGDVTVKLNEAAVNCVVKGSIFGCNNVYGSPQGAVEVHVYGTKGITEKPTRMTRAEYLALTGEEEPHIYDLEAVYGGGNKAAYEPVNAMLTGTDDATKDLIAAAHTRVIIEGCERSSIRQVYGGGNAASTPGTEVTIKGAYEIEEVFGGGNGKPSAAVPDNNGANVGYQADTDTDGTAGASYGSGKAQVNINGGTIHAVYGGSNTKGNVRIAAVAMLDETSEENCFLVDEAYGGGKSAPMDGRAELQLGCIPGVGNVYGGARAANVNNDVILTITNGDFDNVYGGNNESGTINGSITLNVEETGCRPVNITNLYGGGNLAAYPGPNAKSDFTKEITINARSFTTIGNLFGGGYGSTAVVTGDTYVKINQVFGTTYSIQNNQQVYTTATALGTVGNVYGGGSEADVEGNTHVRIGTAETVTFVTGPQKNVAQDVIGANISGNVYGGGLSADVSGDSEVKIGTVDLTATNKVGFTIAQDVYGGGEGSTTNVDGNVVVEVGAVNTDANTNSTKPYLGDATISGSVYGGSAFGSVNTPSTTSGDTTTPASGTVIINLHKGTIAGAVYGGGKGQNASGSGETAIPEYTAHVYGKSTVTLNAATVGTGIYGGCNERGRMHDETEVNLLAGSVGTTTAHAVFGGGFGQNTFVDGKATVNAGSSSSVGSTTLSGDIYGGSALGTVADTEVNLYKLNGTTFSHNIFGGGKGDSGNNIGALVTGTTTVNIYDFSITSDDDDVAAVYGGCNDQGTTATAIVNLIGGTIGTAPASGATSTTVNKVFGGGKGHATTTNTATVYVGTDASTGSSNIYSNVYGGSALGAVGTAIVNLNKATTLNGHVFGGGMGNANTTATISTSATVNQNNITMADGKNIYGGCNVNGTAATTTVTLTGGSTTNVFGGGLGPNTSVSGDVMVNVGMYDNSTISGNPTITGDIYGGSAQGTVNKNEAATTKTTKTTVHLYAGQVGGNVYGGGLGVKPTSTDTGIPAYVYGDVLVDLNDHNGTCVVNGSIFGCNNAYGSPEGHVIVHVYKTVSRTGQASDQYDLASVYGGGNEADYEPNDATQSTEVIIEGCDETSIGNVYGGGNAAAVPASDVLILGTKIINNVFGGGNGESGAGYAAHVGFHRTSETTKTNYTSGLGRTYVKLVGGTINTVYGGSNSNGDIRGGSNIIMPSKDNYTAYSCCDNLVTQNVYGGGRNADMSSGTNIVMGCMPNSWIEDVYAGSREADVSGDVSLTITSGKFKRVFGGNKTSGKLKGSIKVNIEETGNCGTPIIIGELYAGGNEADYSIYGYKDDGTPMTADELRTRLTTENPGKTTAQIEELFQAAKKNEPQLNVRAFTSIGAIYGGGYSAKMYADPTVSINVVKGSHYNDDALEAGSTPALAGITPATTLPYPAHAKGAIGAIGNVFGGGNLATVYGSTTVNIGTEPTVMFVTEPNHLGTKGTGEQTLETSGVAYIQRTDGLYEAKSEGANILSNVYGGGNLADVTGNTFVNVCAVKSGDSYAPVAEGTAKVNIAGNVYGGGKGLADNFLCDKAMVGTADAGVNEDFSDNTNYKDGNTSVIIGNGTVGTLDTNNKLVEGTGNVYGGGEIGRVEKNTTVWIGIGNGDDNKTSAPIIRGDVFGGGKGDKEHGYAALVRGNPTVIVQGDAKVGHSVYGAGEIASVARYKVAKTVAEATANGVSIGMPYALANSTSGYCTVKVHGNAEIGPDNMKMVHPEVTNGTDKPDDAGHVFAAGKGFLPENYTYADKANKPKRMMLYNSEKYTNANKNDWDYVSDTNHDNVWEYFPNREKYIEFIQTQALASNTELTIDGNAFVKGSVYGGSENGLVQYDTKVYIKGGQIGAGKNTTKRHVEDYPTVWDEDFVLPANVDLECASWDYGLDTNSDGVKDLFAPYDPNANATGDLGKYPAVGTQAAKSTEGGRRIATDGHTYYGNVFGGGSGSVPYFDTTEGRSKYLNSAGTVKGNTAVEISGGHILTSVYGGCEATNVLGKATVKMSGGSIGVPRTLNQIIAHPVTCYLFGGGKGDQRIFFNKDTNVEDVDVQISGGRIYGSVFGGGEDGHVLRDVTMSISGTTKIGTWGTSYVDGNVFGGGRGFGGDAYTAGNIGGSVKMTISGGIMLGSIYGGGRLGSVGYGLYNSTGEEAVNYGVMRDDTKNDAGANTTYYTADGPNKLGRGHIDITISGGTIGNTREFIVPSSGNTPSSLDFDNIASWTDDNWKTWKTHNNIPLTEFDKATRKVTHTKGGNVFAGGMGRRFKLDGVTEIDETTDGIDWKKLGNVKSTKLTISGNTQIKGNVYGGGEMGAVTGKHQLLSGTTPVTDTNGDPVVAGTEIIIEGSSCVIGTEVGTGTDKYYFGNVYGGGMGVIYQDENNAYVLAGGDVADSTKVSMSNGAVMASVYGGGELGQVFGSADVAVSGGSIGVSGFGGAEYGNIYGGGKGSTEKLDAGLIKTNTWVTVSGSPQIWHNIYGGGAYGSVGTITRGSDATYIHVPGQTSVPDMPKSWAENTGSALVRILSGTIGRNGNENGMVFGSSRGDVGAPGEIHDKLAWVKKAKVVIGATGTTGPNIKGSVYGSGENGHLFQDAVVEIHSGVVGIAEGEPIGSYTAGGASYPYRGNVYGGGCGTDKYYSNPTGVANPHDGKGDKYNPLAGIVLGDASVTMDGGTVVHNIYGAGAMGSVGTMTTDENNHLVISSGGKTTIDISGGTVGVDGIVRDDGNSNGNVFGAARGDKDTDQTDVALVKTTEVTISQAEGKTTYVWGNVYGGGETGDVGTYYTITEEGANKGTNAYLGGSGACVVEVTGGTVHHNVFGAGKGESSKYECKKAMVSSTDVTIDTNAKVNGNVYGGGEVGRVEYNTVVKIGSGAGAETGGTSKPEIGGSVYGAGAGLETHGYSALVRGNSTVTVEGNAKVNGNVYGGGEKATVGKYWVSLVAQDPNEDPPSGFPDGMPYKTRDGGICTVNIQGYAQVGPDAGGSKNAGNVFGAGKGVEPSYSAGESQRMKNGDAWEKFTAEDKYLEFLQTLALASVTNVTVDGNAKVKGSVYGGSESGFVQDESFVTIKNGEIGTATYGDIYGGGRGLSNFAEAGRVKGGVTIAVDGGTAFGSVYGGGELGIVTGAVLVNINNGIIEKDVYGGGALANTNTNNWNGTTLTETYLEVGGLIAGTSSVAGYYTKSGDNYTILTTGTAVAGTKYYRKVNTTVNLLGGLIKGDAYGGGLGDLKARGGDHKDVQAMVYGDVFITLGDAAATKATAFTISNYDGTQVVKSGRVFGCNNLNGSPKGNVLVTVNKTVSLDAQGVVKAKPTLDTHTYELAAVYGGGNLANYMPVGDGRKPSVLINSCDVSIEEVYGGGNAAFVPETDVLVLGAYEIENVFGGGNGEDNYTLDGGASWITNPGADVGSTTKSGNAKTVLKGGYIHVGYGGSNSRGTIYGDISITKESGDDSKCTLNVVELYGAGKDADVEGDLILVMGCSETRTEAVYGCSMNANVKGNVELTITSGEYGKVFGGNNVSGAIFGHIIVNIEETGCTPIVIDELYGCGNDAAYSTFGYYQDGTIDGTENGKPKYVARKSLTDGTAVTFTGKPHTVPPYADPEVNVISCTRIGKVFGGGLGTGATVYGNPTVNINMIPGKYAKQIDRDGTAGADNDPNALGEVGSGYSYKDNVTNETVNVEGGVFGGGNAANVEGNTTVNIGTAEKVDVIILTPDNKPVYDTDGVTPKTTKEDVKGAYIVGNVFGGGEGRDDSFTCEKAMVNGNEGTHVNIGNGTVKGNVYGGGKVGRVENNTVVTIGLASGTSAPVIEGNVFGAGRGVNSHGYSALVRGTSTVTVQADSKVRKSVYGGGETASVGKYKVVNGLPEVLDDSQNPYSGYCYVTIKGNAEIGPDDMQMTAANGPDDTGHVFGAGKGILPYEGYGPNEKPYHMNGKQHLVDGVWDGKTWEDDPTYYDAYNPTKEDAAYFKFVRSLALATHTDVTIGGNAFVKGSVYGGSENGFVQRDTKVTIQEKCQIGNGNGVNRRYTETEWTQESLPECASWPYGEQVVKDGKTVTIYAPYDKFARTDAGHEEEYSEATGRVTGLSTEGGRRMASDGHTFYGNVFGGGSGLTPYKPGKWFEYAGVVHGNSTVEITGGHILTSVYGGNENTDVKGTSTVKMSGGTLGVPRTVEQITKHPVTCYLFGAGKGDQRVFFNTWTNVENAIVEISGDARIYGSVFGGGEDGHILKDSKVTIKENALIGTTGTSYVDGNIFGAGRGFSGDAQTAGTVGGNVEINISGGKMLGSVYGGGRLASVGTDFTAPNDPNYGQFREDDADGTYGHVTVNISGGTIGNTVGNAESGNVFGGSMGRLNLLSGNINPIWPKMAQVKETTVTISGDAVIKRNVYGGGELGTVRDNATVTINGGTVNRDVYGAGYGSKDYETKTKITVKMPKEGVTNPTSASDYDDVNYVFTPMIFAGCVGQNTYVNIAGGKVRKSVYGGGEMASVGIMDCRVKIDNNATDPVYTEGTDKYVYEHFHSHLDENNGFALSWPFHFENAPGYFGETHVNITGGRIGVANGDTDINTDNGDVYGGGKGIAGEYKNYVYCANVGSAEVTIDYPAGNTATPQNYMTNADIECIAGAVYGGAENGHVMGDTKLTLKNGLIGHSMYGGGSGKGTFSTTLLKIGSTSEHYTRDIYSFTAGKVFGNSTVEMSGGTVVRNVYGGGNMGSVGKGNYAGGADDYSTSGYGEKLSGNLWDNVSKESQAFLTSGICTVNITGGTIGYIDESDPSNSMYPWNSTASLPYGNVFGGCRGESAPNIVETPRYLYSPEFFVGYANETAVTIGKTDGSGPTILGSVYGGGMDGHIRRDASVTILGGEIGIPFTEANKTKVKTSDPNDIQWLARGNVYGSGSGIGKYKYDFDYDGKYESTVKYNNGRATVDTKEEDYSTSAGSVTRFTTVDIKGGTIHRNVYGGGSLSSIGAPKIGQSYDPYHPGDSEHSSEVGKQSLNKVTISGGHIGDADCLTSGYGGDVNGGSRGAMAFENSLANPASFANSVYTEVTISDDADVKGNVFGGGEAGIVKHDTEVKMQGGTVGNDLYGAGDMADVNGNTKVLLTGGTVTRDVFGGARGTATIAANVGGDVLVDLNGGVVPAKKGAVVKRNIFGANNVNGTPQGHVLVYVHGTQNENTAAINAKVDGKYDVLGVYGGGNQSDYVPASADTKQSTEVIIEGCDLTSIDEVYGGGYGAATPATSVLVKGTKIINNVYGGGYGASTDTYTNPGANVGYRSNKAPYDQGTGKAIVQLMAGTVNNVYGGSNTLGDIRGGSSVTNVANDGSAGCCEKLTVGEIYGGGKQADMFGGAEIILGCMPNDWIGAIYGGAENADIGGDVGLTLTSGKFGRVFGGNKSGGKIDGYIEVNIEENPECSTPIIIGGLYGGGNEAPYTYPLLDKDPNYLSPRVNVRAFTSIGNIYGGGFGATATVTGNPLVNINVVEGGREYAGEDKPLEDGTTVTLHARSKDAKMGVIGNVFGGGNAAPVIGNPRVEIGTAAKQKMLSLQTKDANGKVIEVEKDVLGADIRGNVYGGGNNAAVTGDPKVVIGQRKE